MKAYFIILSVRKAGGISQMGDRLHLTDLCQLESLDNDSWPSVESVELELILVLWVNMNFLGCRW